MSCIVCGDLGEYGDELRRRMKEGKKAEPVAVRSTRDPAQEEEGQ